VNTHEEKNSYSAADLARSLGRRATSISTTLGLYEHARQRDIPRGANNRRIIDPETYQDLLRLNAISKANRVAWRPLMLAMAALERGRLEEQVEQTTAAIRETTAELREAINANREFAKSLSDLRKALWSDFAQGQEVAGLLAEVRELLHEVQAERQAPVPEPQVLPITPEPEPLLPPVPTLAPERELAFVVAATPLQVTPEPSPFFSSASASEPDPMPKAPVAPLQATPAPAPDPTAAHAVRPAPAPAPAPKPVPTPAPAPAPARPVTPAAAPAPAERPRLRNPFTRGGKPEDDQE